MNDDKLNDDKLFWSVLCALLSIFIPGLGQAVQKRWKAAILFFLACFVLWFLWLGWLIHIWAVFDAAFYEEPEADKSAE